MLFEITPNWHPAIVHFPIALTLSGIAALWIGALLRDTEFNRQLQNFGHWSLRLGFVSAVVAAWFGILAFMGVPHDEIAYKAKTLHRDWALVTIAVFIPFFILSCLRQRLTRHITRAFTAGLIIPALLFFRTGWLGGEIVYRYGVGVESVPQIQDQTQQEMRQRSDEPEAEGPVSNTGDMSYPDRDFESDTGEAGGGERQDNQGD
jgi:uncharacterized membrane protein